MGKRIRQRLRLPVHGWVLIFCGLCSARTLAAETPVMPRIVLARAGLHFTVRDQSWNLFSARLENSGPEVQAVLMFEQQGHSSGQQLVWQRPVVLPEQSSRVVTFPVYMDVGPPTGETIRTIGTLRLTDGVRQVWDTEPVLARSSLHNQVHALALGRQPASAHYLGQLRPDGGAREAARSVQDFRGAPGQWAAWQAFDVVLLTAHERAGLNAAQFRALLQWVHQGGVLLFSPGGGMPPGGDPDWGPYLPVLYSGEARLSPVLRGLPEGVAPFDAEEGLWLQRMEAQAGAQRLAGTPTEPLAVAHKVGQGTIVALGMDVNGPAFQQWEGAADFLNAIVPWPSPLERYAAHKASASADVDALMAHLAGIRVLSKYHAGQYLFGVMALLGGILVLTRLGSKPERGWLACSLLAPLLALAVIRMASRQTGEDVAYLNELSMVRGQAGASALTVQSLLALTAPRDEQYRFTAKHAELALRPGPSATRPPERFAVSHADRPVLEDLAVRARSLRRFAGQGRLYQQAPAFSAEVTDEGLALLFDNRGGQDAEDVFVRWNRLVWLMGDVPAGEQRQVMARGARAHGGYTRGVLRHTTQRWRETMVETWFEEGRPGTPLLLRMTDLPALPLDGEWRQPGLYFWTREPVFPLQGIPPAERRGMVFWALEAPVGYARGELLFPKGVLDLDFVQRAPGMSAGARGSLYGMGGGRARAVFTLPTDAPDFTLRELRLFIDFQSEIFDYRVALLPGDCNSDDPAARKVLDVRGGMVAIDAAAHFYQAATRSLCVEFEVFRRSAQTAAPGGRPGTATTWHLRELDLELTGSTP